MEVVIGLLNQGILNQGLLNQTTIAFALVVVGLLYGVPLLRGGGVPRG